MSKILILIKSLSLKWKVTFLLFVLSGLMLLAEEVFLTSSSNNFLLNFFLSSFEIAYIFFRIIDLFIINISNNFAVFLIPLLLLIYCFCFAFIFDLILFKKKFLSYKVFLLVGIIFLSFNYFLVQLIYFLDKFFNGAYLFFD